MLLEWNKSFQELCLLHSVMQEMKGGWTSKGCAQVKKSPPDCSTLQIASLPPGPLHPPADHTGLLCQSRPQSGHGARKVFPKEWWLLFLLKALFSAIPGRPLTRSTAFSRFRVSSRNIFGLCMCLCQAPGTLSSAKLKILPSLVRGGLKPLGVERSLARIPSCANARGPLSFWRASGPFFVVLMQGELMLQWAWKPARSSNQSEDRIASDALLKMLSEVPTPYYSSKPSIVTLPGGIHSKTHPFNAHLSESPGPSRCWMRNPRLYWKAT